MRTIKRATVFMIVLSISITAGLSQTGVDPRMIRGFEAIQKSHLRADLTFLASDELEGRMSLQRGSEVAIQFIAAEFARAGLKPISGDSYLQQIGMIEYRPEPREMRITLSRHGQDERFEYVRDFIGTFPYDLTVKAPVVFAGYGITAPEFGYDDYAGLDAKGKIALVFDHEPQENDPK